MFGVIGHALVAIRLTAIQGQVNRMGIGCGIGNKGDILLVEGIITVIAQVFSDILAPLVQIIEIQQVTLMDHKIGRVPKDDITHVIVGNLIGNRANIVRLAQRDVIVNPCLALNAVGLDMIGDHIIHIATVAQRGFQLLGAGLGQCGIVDNGGCSHTLNPAIEPLGTVLA